MLCMIKASWNPHVWGYPHIIEAHLGRKPAGAERRLRERLLHHEHLWLLVSLQVNCCSHCLHATACQILRDPRTQA